MGIKAAVCTRMAADAEGLTMFYFVTFCLVILASVRLKETFSLQNVLEDCTFNLCGIIALYILF